MYGLQQTYIKETLVKWMNNEQRKILHLLFAFLVSPRTNGKPHWTTVWLHFSQAGRRETVSGAKTGTPLWLVSWTSPLWLVFLLLASGYHTLFSPIFMATYSGISFLKGAAPCLDSWLLHRPTLHRLFCQWCHPYCQFLGENQCQWLPPRGRAR